MKKLWITLPAIFLFCLVTSSNAQTCPVDMVCISREAALKALADADKVKALETQIAVLEKAFEDTKRLVETANREFIQASVEATFYKQQLVRVEAEKSMLLKEIRSRCRPFSICLN